MRTFAWRRNLGGMRASEDQSGSPLFAPPEVSRVTPQEEQLIRNLADRVNSTQLHEKDTEAEELLKSSFASNPDSLYILVQTVLVQNFALDQAKAQVADLQKQVQQAQQANQPPHASSFLGGLFGHHDPEPAAASQQRPYQPAAPPSQSTEIPFQPVRQTAAVPGYNPSAAAPAYAAVPQQQFAPVASGQPSFLRGAMQTAAGVAAGALAFEGVESILRGFSHPGLGWGGPAVGGFGMGPGMEMGPGFGTGFDRPVEETVVNNYYDQPAGSQELSRNEGSDQLRFNDAPDQNEHHEAGDQGQSQFSDASYNPQNSNDPSADPSSYNPPDPYLQQDPQAGFDQDNSDQGSFDQGDVAQNDPGEFDPGQGDSGDSGGFDDGGGGFDGGGDFS
jgi:uncharacterized protein